MKFLKFVAVLALAAAAFGGGYVLRAKKATPAGASAAATPRKVLYWVDPMHPAYTSDKPGIAPDCGMALEPVYADQPASGGATPPGGTTAAALPPGTIHISAERQQLIGVRFATAETSGGDKRVRTVGKVAFDETRIAHVHTRFEGWIEKVFVNFTGDTVKKDEPMFTVYSPEMLASQQELLLAAKARTMMAGNPLPSAAQQGDSLFDASRRRLELWDLSPDQIDRVLASGQPIRNITIAAPIAGYVTERNVFPNQKVGPEADLYTIVDLSRVWVLADVFETDIPSVRVGQTARVTLPYAENAALTARVNYIQPAVDPTTRTMKVRLDMPNPGMRLKPDMFVNVDFAFGEAARLTVPAEAVVDTGQRQTVFVDLGSGNLEPRRVTVGGRIGDRVAILSGLTAGERVVASGTFLIDSESQLKSAAGEAGAHVHD